MISSMSMHLKDEDRMSDDQLAEYRSKRSAADTVNAMDGAATAKRGERNLYRLMRTLKKRGGGSSDYRLLRTLKRSPGNFGDRFPIFRHWALVHKRESTAKIYLEKLHYPSFSSFI